MKKIIAIQADKINSINIKTDTTFQLALEAQNRGYRIFWYEIKDLNLLNKRVIAKADQVKFFDNSKNYFKKINKSNLDLSKTKFVLMRQNPPFNMDYITATFYLEFLKKTKVVNNPKSVRNISEKFYSINFLKMMPPTIFTENIQEIKKFLKKNRKIVIKPIHGFAGKNILFIQNRLNISSISRYLKSFGTVMVQKYLPGVKKGDKRIFIINGKVCGAIQRIPSKGSILSNISQGGTAVKTKLNFKEKKVANTIAKELKKENIFFAGIDLVSGYLIGDINVTSPTGLPQYKELTGINLAKNFWDQLENLK
ncbi:MAG: glutathione synthase [Candidatus Pelagibacter sp.]|mgnify:FL=1|jgi:glutathione synthase|tara:strand:+ start:2297 stop:3226 length:930 start_codon:yes stop_codon:yes gene_type:complete